MASRKSKFDPMDDLKSKQKGWTYVPSILDAQCCIRCRSVRILARHRSSSRRNSRLGTRTRAGSKISQPHRVGPARIFRISGTNWLNTCPNGKISPINRCSIRKTVKRAFTARRPEISRNRPVFVFRRTSRRSVMSLASCWSGRQIGLAQVIPGIFQWDQSGRYAARQTSGCVRFFKTRRLISSKMPSAGRDHGG